MTAARCRFYFKLVTVVGWWCLVTDWASAEWPEPKNMMTPGQSGFVLFSLVWIFASGAYFIWHLIGPTNPNEA